MHPVTDDFFTHIVASTLQELPNEFRKKLENVEIVLEDIPTSYQLSQMSIRGGLPLGLYEGIPHTQRGNYGIGPVLPDKISLFKKPLLYIAMRTGADVRQVVRDTLLHEIGHHFGMSEEDLQAFESKRVYKKKRPRRSLLS